MQQFDRGTVENVRELHRRLIQLGDGLDSLGVAIGSMSFDENTTAGLGFAVASLGIYARETLGVQARDTLGVNVEGLFPDLDQLPERAAGQEVRSHG